MPELPEVENTRRYLEEQGLVGSSFESANIGWARTIKTPSLEDFVLGLAGRKVTHIGRRGKYLIITLSDDTYNPISFLIIHLGMTGGLRLHPKSTPRPELVRHTFSLQDGRELRFIDPRKFGHMWLVNDWENALPKFGPEPLESEFTIEFFVETCKQRKIPIKALLLEQSVVAGLGNLYVDESLYRSGIYPNRLASQLKVTEVSTLHRAIITTLNAALRQYDEHRELVSKEPEFGLSTWTIPRKIGELCPTCDTSINRLIIRGRTSFFCSSCQLAD
ncbi:MAG: DNA-formamidopyrimidine glycosylase [Chloroflexota bacterium]|nr:DNA-formamidopyrimidine glycosylase [Chloroflexota bacterium]